MTSKLTRERLQEIAEDGFLKHGESKELARMALAAMDSSESVELPLDYLHGHKDGLEWAAQLAEANHPETGDWLYDDPIELSKAIRKGRDMPPVQPVADSEPVAWTWNYREQWYVTNDERRAEFVAKDGDVAVLPLYRHAQSAPVVLDEVTAEDCPAFVKYDVTEVDEAWVRGFNACRAATLQASNCRENSNSSTNNFREMLETSTNSPVIPDTWIPVSERMPVEFEAVIAFDGDQVYGEAMYSSGDGFTIDGYDPCDRVQLQSVTHWMPLPAGPQEVK